jgi:hypothetical protein
MSRSSRSRTSTGVIPICDSSTSMATGCPIS